MAIIMHPEPDLKNPVMFCGWPGIGNIGIIAIDTLRNLLRAAEFAEIEPWDFFNPRKVVIEEGLLQELRFPENKFYYQRLDKLDLIFFIGQEQTFERRTAYAEGEKAYQLANLVLDVAEKFNCSRIYTSGAAVAQIHHTHKPRVWAVPNRAGLLDEIKSYPNTILMSHLEGRSGQGSISGLNGLMLGVARKRGFDALCLMGEIPYYLQGAPWPYPKASRSVLEVITRIHRLRLRFNQLDELSEKVEQNIEQFVQRILEVEDLPDQVKEEIEKLRDAPPAHLGPITEEEQKRIMEHLDELFHQETDKDDRTV